MQLTLLTPPLSLNENHQSSFHQSQAGGMGCEIKNDGVAGITIHSLNQSVISNCSRPTS